MAITHRAFSFVIMILSIENAAVSSLIFINNLENAYKV